MNRFLVAVLACSLLGFAPVSRAQTNTDPNQSVARIGSKPQTGDDNTTGKSGDSMAGGSKQNGSSQAASTTPLPAFSGNIPSSINADRTYGINAPGTLIGPSPDNGQPDPRFPHGAGSSGGGNEINGLSASETTSQAPNGANKYSGGGYVGAGQGQVGGTTSDINEGLPSASKYNDGHNSTEGSGGTGAGANGTEVNPGGAARLDRSTAQNNNNPTQQGREIGSETKGAAPYALGAGAVIIGAFLFAVLRSRGRKL